MTRSAHLDSFARDNLPERAQCPDFLFDLPELRYPERLNCVSELLDRRLASGEGDRARYERGQHHCASHGLSSVRPRAGGARQWLRMRGEPVARGRSREDGAPSAGEAEARSRAAAVPGRASPASRLRLPD